MYVTEESIQRARAADLYTYLIQHHPNLFRQTGRDLRLKTNNSLVIHSGFAVYHDFATNESGNGIDFLMNYLHYSFQDAVMALSGAPQINSTFIPQYMHKDLPGNGGCNSIVLPAPAPWPHSRMYAYLLRRKIPKELVDELSRQGLIYQSAKRNNIVFVNRERDYFEVRGTFTLSDRPFHGVRKACSNRFWYFNVEKAKANIVYITEAAIDAMSLYLLQRKNGMETTHSIYASIGGVSNYAAIERIMRQTHAVLAVDNDSAGKLCRKRYPEMEALVPVHKDWNEDWIFSEAECR